MTGGSTRRPLRRSRRPAIGSATSLTAHSDDIEGKNRLFAYVLNFTPTWKPDWGGLLAFIDGDGHISEAYTPAFNALNIFKVPQMHTVTQVAGYAGAERAVDHRLVCWRRSRAPSARWEEARSVTAWGPPAGWRSGPG